MEDTGICRVCFQSSFSEENGVRICDYCGTQSVVGSAQAPNLLKFVSRTEVCFCTLRGTYMALQRGIVKCSSIFNSSKSPGSRYFEPILGYTP
jgi:hypothetical protein